MTRFAITGVAGFIAPRHLKAIKETGSELVCAMDTRDSVGLLDSYFPMSEFFTNETDFESFLQKSQLDPKTRLDFLSVCSPNHLHKKHIELGLKYGLKVICEKPLVVHTSELKSLEKSAGDIFTILQLRLHPALIALKNQIAAETASKRHVVDLVYITSRGKWYDKSWKADEPNSGGIVTNIGIHFFDMMTWIFGAVESQQSFINEGRRAAGVLELERASVRWFLSIDEESLPKDVRSSGKRTFRTITVDGKEIEFSEGFTDLHTRSYEEILAGRGFDLNTARPAIELVETLRSLELSKNVKPEGALSLAGITP